jgi:hypothetical protein
MFGAAPTGHTADAAAARSASAYPRMNPRPGNVFFHTLARMLPLHRYMSQVYRFAEKFPPSGGLEDGFAPIWETATFPLNARQTLEARINVQREWHMLAVNGSTSSNVNGGFRVQLYDVKKKRRLADRGIGMNNYLGLPQASAAWFLREPYPLCEKNAQLLVIVQNLETVSNTVQVAVYGVARRFNFPN